MKTKNKTFKKIGAIALCIGLLASIGIGAYLTDTDVKSDVYTVGNVQAEIVSVGDMEMDNVGALLPNTLHQYERAATNTGINDAYVFMSVTIPFDYVGAAHIDGTQLDGPMTLAQIFTPYTADMAKGVGSEWKLVDAGYIGQYEIGMNGYRPGTHEDYYTIVGNTITYVYGFIGDNADGSLKALASGETTSNLVDQFAVNNFYKVANITGEISTKLYAIQSNHVNGGLTDVNGVWAVINTALVGEIEAPELACQHVVVEDCVCQACGELSHTLELVLPAGEATCTMPGAIVDIYGCYDCERLYADANGATEITEDNLGDYVTNPLGHNMVDGEYSLYCTRCNYEEPVGDNAHRVNTETCTCEDCGETIHNFSGDDDNCIYCGVGHTHDMKFIPAREETCYRSGYAFDAYKCTICKKLYTDENGENRVDREDWIIDRLDHNYVDGTCTICGSHNGGNTDDNNGTPNVPETPEIQFDPANVTFSSFQSNNEDNVFGGMPENTNYVEAYVQNLTNVGDKVTFMVSYRNSNDVDALVTAEIVNSNEEYFNVSFENETITIPACSEGTFTVTVELDMVSDDYISCNLVMTINAVEAN